MFDFPVPCEENETKVKKKKQLKKKKLKKTKSIETL